MKYNSNLMKEKKIAVIGLGYVGLPLAVEFGKKFTVLGFDIDVLRIRELVKGFDRTGESNSYMTGGELIIDGGYCNI